MHKTGEIVNVAVIGVGYLGTIHARIYSELENVNLVGVVDIDKNRGLEIAEQYKTKYFANHAEIIDLVDAVSITVPTSFHLACSIPFITNKKAVLIEKPIAHSIDAAKTIINEASRNGTMVQVGHLERFNPVITYIQDKMDNPMFVEFIRIGPFVTRGTDVDVVRELMIHDLDLINYLINDEIISVDAIGMPILSDNTDIANARVVFKNGCRANIIASRVSSKKERRIRIFQRDGYYNLDLINQTGRFFFREFSGNKHIINEKDLSIEKGEPLKLELQSFIDSYIKRKTPVVSAEDGLSALLLSNKVNDCIFIPSLS